MVLILVVNRTQQTSGFKSISDVTCSGFPYTTGQSSSDEIQ